MFKFLSTQQQMVFYGAIGGMLGVILGAFGAHGLKKNPKYSDKVDVRVH